MIYLLIIGLVAFGIWGITAFLRDRELKRSKASKLPVAKESRYQSIMAISLVVWLPIAIILLVYFIGWSEHMAPSDGLRMKPD
jgi:Na+/H+ antiporter NhaC